MAINNIAGSVSVADIQRALIGSTIKSEPILADGLKAWNTVDDNTVINGNKISYDSIKATEMTKLSTANGSIFSTNLSYQRTYSFNVDFDEAVWKIQVPGVVKEDIDVFTVAETVYVKIKDDYSNLQLELAEGESVKSTKLDLGVLTITIDRPAKRQAIEIE